MGDRADARTLAAALARNGNMCSLEQCFALINAFFLLIIDQNVSVHFPRRDSVWVKGQTAECVREGKKRGIGREKFICCCGFCFLIPNIYPAKNVLITFWCDSTVVFLKNRKSFISIKMCTLFSSVIICFTVCSKSFNICHH